MRLAARGGSRPTSPGLGPDFHHGLLAAAALLLGGACTKTLEQPAPAPAPAAAPAGRPAPPPTRPARVTAPDPAPAAIAALPDAAPDLRRLDRDALQRVLNDAIPTFAGCLREGPAGAAAVNLELEVEPSGRASKVKVTGATPAGESCVLRAVLGLSLPKFDGPSEKIAFPVSVYRHAPAAAAAAPAPLPTSPTGVLPVQPASGAPFVVPGSGAPTVQPTAPPSNAPGAPPVFVNP